MPSKSKKKKNKSLNMAKALQRKLAKQQGFYDRRFQEKMVSDKKKEYRKRLARKKVNINSEE